MEFPEELRVLSQRNRIFLSGKESEKSGPDGPCQIKCKKNRLRWISLDVDGDIHSCRQIELFQFIDSLRRRLDDVDQALVGTLFKLVHGLLVNVGGSVQGDLLDPGRQRDRA